MKGKYVLRAPSWRAVRVWQRNFDVYKATWKINFIPPLLEPLLYLLAFGVGLGRLVPGVTYEGAPVSYLVFIAPGLIAAAVMNHGFFETSYTSFVRMYFQRTFHAIISTPLSMEDVVLGEILWGATKAVMAASFILFFAGVLGLVVWPASLAVLPLAFLGGMTFASLGMCFTSKIKNIEMFNLPVFLFITPMFLLGGVFFPVSTLPPWAARAASFMPLSMLVDVMRALCLGHFHAGHILPLFVLLSMAVVCTVFSLVMMRRRILK